MVDWRRHKRAGQAGDFLSQADLVCTLPNDWLVGPEEIAALPDLLGYGNGYDLHQAMVLRSLPVTH